MSKLRTDWKGIIVPVVTPFSKDYSLDEAACRQILEQLIDDGVHGIIVAGSTGEWFTLSNEERIRLFEIAADQVNGRVTLLGGTSAIATRDAVTLTQKAKDIGLDGTLVLPPPYALPNEAETIAYYRTVAKVGLPIMVYNNPGRTQININAKLAAKLALIDQVVAFKDSVKDLYQMSETIRTVGDRISMFCGLEPYALPLIQRGAVGIVAMTPNIIGRRGVDLYKYAAEGNWSEAVKVEGLIDKLYAAFYSAGYCAYVVIKECMNLLGRNAGLPRPPLLPMNEADREALRGLLREMDLLR
jgi:4-hydroxy-tetrahydrodipicolinate synthase